MPSASKDILEFTHIDPCLRWVDKNATRLLHDGKMPKVTISYDDETEDLRSPEQSSKVHAMIADIVKQAVFKTPALTVKMSDHEYDEGKALLVRWFEREMESLGEPLRHGSKVVIDPFTGEQITIRASTTKFLKKETVSFVDWLYATGNDGGVKWSEPALQCYADYRQAQDQ